MCCNADILFSVLVLHWVTSKDSHGGSNRSSAVTGLSLSSPLGNSSGGRRAMGLSTLDPLSSSHSLADKMDTFGLYGGPKVEALITTKISAGKAMNVAAEDIELDARGSSKGFGWKGKKGSISSTKRLQVNVASVVEQESGPRTDVEEGEDIADVIRCGNTRSTDDLVDR